MTDMWGDLVWAALADLKTRLMLVLPGILAMLTPTAAGFAGARVRGRGRPRPRPPAGVRPPPPGPGGRRRPPPGGVAHRGRAPSSRRAEAAVPGAGTHRVLERAGA